MTDRTDSEKPLEPDADRLWLKGSGARISVRRTTDPRALDIVEAVRRRYAKGKQAKK
jgi:hypothetical protein